MTNQKTNGKIILGKGGRDDVIVAKVNGKERPLFVLSSTELFTSLKEFAEMYNLNYDTTINKFNQGISLTDILNSKAEIPADTTGHFFERPESNAVPAKVDTNHAIDPARSEALTGIPHAGIPCDYAGKDYISLKECAEDYNVEPQTFYNRRRKGYSVHECLFGRSKSVKEKTSKKHIPSNKIPVTVDGIHYDSATAFSKAMNVPYHTVVSRLRNGTPLSPKLVPYDGKHGKKTTAVIPGAKSVKPASIIPGTKTVGFTFHGKKYSSEEELVNTYKVSMDVFNSRKAMGMSREECLFGKKKSGRKRTECSYNGIWYPSLYALTRSLGINYDAFIEARRIGFTIDECVELQKKAVI